MLISPRMNFTRSKLRARGALAAALFVQAIFAAPAQSEDRVQLAFDSLPQARMRFGGVLDARLRANEENWLLRAPAANPGLLQMFQQRDRQPVPQLVDWAGEFVGKYLLSLTQACQFTAGRPLTPLAQEIVSALRDAQAEDGYLGPFPKHERLLGHWDLWGHYHVIQALLRWYEQAGDREALATARRAADLIVRTFLNTGKRVFDTGSHEMNMAIIHGLAELYRATGEERYLAMAREVEKDWERAGDYLRTGLAGVEFYKTPRPRWESLHDLQGLLSLYRITGDDHYRIAFDHHWRSILRFDRRNTGGFSSGEQATGNPFAPTAIETCCTIAWMALTLDELRLTGDPLAADEFELSLFNAALGAQHPSGSWWTYSTPMDGVREASAHAIVFQSRAGTPELNCCSVNGPRAFGMLAEWALMEDGDGLVLNHLGPGSYVARPRRQGEGEEVSVEVRGDFPVGQRAEIQVRGGLGHEVQLKVRIPGWAHEIRATLNGANLERARAGAYLSVSFSGEGKDVLVLELPMRLRAVSGEREQAAKVSLYRGPLLLAYDQRWNEFDERKIPPIDLEALASSVSIAPDPKELFGVPQQPWVFVSLPSADGSGLRLCDFAGAGAFGTRYRSWLKVKGAPGRTPRPDRVVIAAALKGDPKPEVGALRDAAGAEATTGPNGESNGALSVNGARQMIAFALDDFPVEEFTIAVRVKIAAFPEKRLAQVFSAWAAPSDDPLRLVIEGGKLFARIEAGAAYSTPPAAIEAGRWHHVAAVKVDGRLILYVDGREVAGCGAPIDQPSQARSVALGGNPNFSGDEFLAASFADFRLLERALTVAEVAQLAKPR